jgi:UPF0755 protein
MKKVLMGLGLLLVVAAVSAAGVWWYLEKRLTEFVATPFGTPEAKVVEIPAGTNAKGIGTLLERERVISNGELFYSWVKHEKLNPAKLKAGEYEFSGPLTPPQVIEKIVKGEVKLYHFTVAEGLRVDEIVPVLAGSDLKLSAEKLAALLKTPEFLRKHGVPADSAEGFLFPDTYSFPRGATEEQVLAKMIGRTLEEFKRATRKPGVELDVLQGITLASIVEKETGANEPEARPHIACVFHNRLRLKMRLDTDPTVLYAKYLLTGQFSKNITKADLQAEHPYNTYKNKGLPQPARLQRPVLRVHEQREERVLPRPQVPREERRRVPEGRRHSERRYRWNREAHGEGASEEADQEADGTSVK